MYQLKIFLASLLGAASAARKLNRRIRSAATSRIGQAPHILFILADDLGYNDVGFRVNRVSPVNPNGYATMNESGVVETPNIDRLASESALLQSYYVQCMCTPTRAALMTGRYTYRTGMGPHAHMPGQPTGLPGSETTMAEVLGNAGYATHIVGKWHLGEIDERYTPTFRGFDSFFGYLGAMQDYFKHTAGSLLSDVVGVDFRNTTLDSRNFLPPNTDAFRDQYSATIFVDRVEQIVQSHTNAGDTRPLFVYLAFQNVHSLYDIAAPPEIMARYTGPYYEGLDGRRRQAAFAAIAALDEAVGRTEQIFKNYGIWNDTVLVFSTDNGGNARTFQRVPPAVDNTSFWPGGSNFPLRGSKYTDWEGGIRGNAFIRGSTGWPIPPSEIYELTHVTDWLPTLAHVAGASVEGTIDGHDLWEVLSAGAATKRTSIVHNCPWRDENQSLSDAAVSPGRSAVIRKGPYKLMYQNELTVVPGGFTYSMPQSPQVGFYPDKLVCDQPASVDGKYLFNIESDPLECVNLAGDAAYTEVMAEMIAELEACSEIAVVDLYYMMGSGEKTQTTVENILVYNEALGESEWGMWDCNTKWPGECGWPIR